MKTLLSFLSKKAVVAVISGIASALAWFSIYLVSLYLYLEYSQTDAAWIVYQENFDLVASILLWSCGAALVFGSWFGYRFYER